jgi:hypothetical protein
MNDHTECHPVDGMPNKGAERLLEILATVSRWART